MPNSRPHSIPEEVETQSRNQELHAARESFRAFVEVEINPIADQIDEEQVIPIQLIQRMAAENYLGALLPKEVGGMGMDITAFGYLCEEIGKASASVLSIFTVHTMVAKVVFRWGTKRQREAWLPRLASGEVVAAFALTEPKIGSDAAHVQTDAEAKEDGYTITGRKTWISAGQFADVFLVIAQRVGQPLALLVERDSPGLSVNSISNLSGFRGAMLAELIFDSCFVAQENLVCREGMGFSHVANMALDIGRFCVACGCTGLAAACLETALNYSRQRKQFGRNVCEHQLVQQMIADMAVDVRAARLLWLHAAALRENADPSSVAETAMAKYLGAQAAVRSSNSALQIHGAAGLPADKPVARYWRDARIMEIIEGTTQMLQLIIARSVVQDAREPW